MAEFLVRVIDKTHTDPDVSYRLTKRGDVIAVQEDGWNWGVQELTNPAWRIIHVPGMSIQDASVFMTPDKIDEKARLHKIDVDSLKKASRDNINAPRDNDYTKAIKIPVTIAEINDVKITKPAKPPKVP